MTHPAPLTPLAKRYLQSHPELNSSLRDLIPTAWSGKRIGLKDLKTGGQAVISPPSTTIQIPTPESKPRPSKFFPPFSEALKRHSTIKVSLPGSKSHYLKPENHRHLVAKIISTLYPICLEFNLFRAFWGEGSDQFFQSKEKNHFSLAYQGRGVATLRNPGDYNFSGLLKQIGTAPYSPSKPGPMLDDWLDSSIFFSTASTDFHPAYFHLGSLTELPKLDCHSRECIFTLSLTCDLRILEDPARNDILQNFSNRFQPKN